MEDLSGPLLNFKYILMPFMRQIPAIFVLYKAKLFINLFVYKHNFKFERSTVYLKDKYTREKYNH